MKKTKIWYLSDMPYTENLAAMFLRDNKNGNTYLLHREDGPAVEWADGRKSWCLCGQACDEAVHYKLVNSSNADLLVRMGQGFNEYIEKRLKGIKLYPKKLDRLE
jgi:hypothetical protein